MPSPRSQGTTRNSTVLFANSWRNRQLPRYRANLRVRVALPGSPKPQIVYARTFDLGLGGVGITVPQAVESGSPAMIGIKLPSDAVSDAILWFPAQLRHRSGFRCGFQFVQLSLNHRLILRHLCGTLPR